MDIKQRQTQNETVTISQTVSPSFFLLCKLTYVCVCVCVYIFTPYSVQVFGKEVKERKKERVKEGKKELI